MIRLGIIGYGYWGPNIVRNFSSLDEVDVISICDQNINALMRASKTYPNISVTNDCDHIISDKSIDAVAIITPVFTHFNLAKKSLLSGKHIFVEKPFTYTSDQASELIDIAKKSDLKIMVDHTFIYTEAVRKTKELVSNNTLGDLYYFDSTRINLGIFQHDVNVIWDLAPHDLSIIDFLIEEKPYAISSTGAAHCNGHEDVAYITVHFESSLIAHINVNWLSPVKVRKTLIGGKNKMLVWNDLNPDETIKIYDKGVDIKDQKGLYELLVSYRSGDVWTPTLKKNEALKHESETFVKYINEDIDIFNDGEAGLRIVKMLEAANRSLEKKGELIYL